eukprot:jgi/Ulvmu1/9259/UM050_0008.1
MDDQKAHSHLSGELQIAPNVHAALIKRPHKRSPGEVYDLAQHFQRTRTFMYGLPTRGLEALCRRLTYEHILPACMLLQQGQTGDCMFMLISGTAHILQRYGSTHVDDEDSHDSQDCGAIVSSACEGSIVGELCLVQANNRHSVSVRAASEGAHFVGIDRAAFWNFVDLTRTGPGSASSQVAAALRTACCRRILEAAPSDRNESDLQALVTFLQGLQAFQDITPPLLKKLCKGMSLEHVNPNGIVCEEDEPGDSMFVVLSGVCDVRAQAPPEKNATDEECSMLPSSFNISKKHLRRVRVTTDELLLSEAQPTDARPVEVPRSSSDATFWIEKFMKTAVQEKDPEVMGHNNEMTPLAVVAAARWRKTLDDVQREEALRREQTARAEEARLTELKARSEGMAALIGKAAAENWKRATFGAEHDNSVDWQQESLNVQQQRLQAHPWTALEHEASNLKDRREDFGEPVELMLHVEERTTGTESLPANRLYNPNKQKLAELGKQQPSNANRILRHELSQRSQLDSVLVSLEKQIRRQGQSQRLGKRDSRRITRALNRAMLSGASRQVRKMRLPKLTRDVARTWRGTDINEHGTDHDDQQSSLEVSEHDSLETDDHSAAATERSAVSTGGESLDTQESFGWRRPQGAQENGTHAAAFRGSLSGQLLSPETAEVYYGPVIKKLLPGQSFGELALLQPHCLRTATVVAAPLHDDSVHASHTLCNSVTQPLDESGHQGHCTSGYVTLLKLTQQLFDESVTSLQVAQLEERLQFLMRFQAFRQLPRDRLTALLVFCHPEHVPAGRVLAGQGTAADCIFMIEEGEVAFVMEGDTMHNPMDPNGMKQHQPIPGLPFVNAACIGAMRKAIEKIDRRGVRKQCSRFGMLQLAERIQAAESFHEVRDEEDDKGEEMATRTVAKHWGQQRKSRLAAVTGHYADGAADQYQARQVSGLVLLSIGSGEMCGESVFGFKEPNSAESGRAGNAKQTCLHEPRQKAACALPGRLLRKRNPQSSRTAMGPEKEGLAQSKPQVYPATLTTVKSCRLLRVNAKDLARFGSMVRETLQTAAWNRREQLLNLSARSSRVNDSLQLAVASSRCTRADAGFAAEQLGLRQLSSTKSGRMTSDSDSNLSKPNAGNFPKPSVALSSVDAETETQVSTRASWLPLPSASSALAGRHIQRVLSLPSAI